MLIQINILIQDMILGLVLFLVIFGVHNSSSVYIDNKKKSILVLGKGPTQELDNATITADTNYSMNFSRSGRKLSLSLYYNGNSSFSYANATKF